ncbi:MAG TPA: hypothetical protein VL522_08275, partial [Bordetella sp.]|nr:hypothetical protein [Bordetella sp.]
AAQTISGTLSAALGSDESVQVSLDNGNTWHTAAASAGDSTWSYATTLSGSDTLKVRVVDIAGNVSTALSQAYVLDTSAPAVTTVSVPSNGTYYTNQDLDFTVHFTEAVTVDTTSGTPRIALVIGSTTVYAIYQSGSGTSDLLFRYVVAGGNQDANGITVGALSANGGALKDAAGNDATLTLNSVGSTAAVNVDGTQPHVTDVAATVPDGVYKTGDTVTITLTFDKAVTVDTSGGTPTLTLNNGGTASYASGSGGMTLVFTYTIAAGQDVADLDYSAVGALLLNGGAIQDAAGGHPDADLSLSAPGAAGSLGANKDIAIDATAPSVTLGGVTLSNDTGASGSDFITSVAAQTIGATLSGPLDVGDKVYGSLDNGGTWIDITGKVSGTTLSWDGATLVGSGMIKLRVVDAAGNVGATSSQAYVLDVAPPGAPTVVPLQSPGSTPVLSGTASLEPGETLTVTVDGATYQVVPSDGQWSLDLASARPVSGSVTLLPGSSYSVTATVTDVAGNASSATGVLSVVTPPSQSEPPPQSDPAPPQSDPILPPPPPVRVVPYITPQSYSSSAAEYTPLFEATPLLGPEVRFLPSDLETSLRFSPLAGSMSLSGLSPPSTSGIASFMDSVRDSRTGPEILTHGSSFGVLVIQASTGSQGLMLNRGMDDQVVPLSDHMEISIPSDVFAHTDPDAVIELTARQPDGRPLPNWVRFDAGSGKFIVDAPKGMAGEIAVKVVARDGVGREAATVFHIRLGGKQAQAQPQYEGRAGLSEQLHQAARQRGGAGLLARFGEVADALHRPNT